mmetsp:Transcript_127724/g.310556  ORF Transcript_127724/g.310556 Transcript_127724/m.310556 type:complete len:289 (-) Transcript_127724:349-1215(-)
MQAPRAVPPHSTGSSPTPAGDVGHGSETSEQSAGQQLPPEANVAPPDCAMHASPASQMPLPQTPATARPVTAVTPLPGASTAASKSPNTLSRVVVLSSTVNVTRNCAPSMEEKEPPRSARRLISSSADGARSSDCTTIASDATGSNAASRSGSPAARSCAASRLPSYNASDVVPGGASTSAVACSEHVVALPSQTPHASIDPDSQQTPDESIAAFAEQHTPRASRRLTPSHTPHSSNSPLAQQLPSLSTVGDAPTQQVPTLSTVPDAQHVPSAAATGQSAVVEAQRPP